jgi:hypothetical protein
MHLDVPSTIDVVKVDFSAQFGTWMQPIAKPHAFGAPAANITAFEVTLTSGNWTSEILSLTTGVIGRKTFYVPVTAGAENIIPIGVRVTHGGIVVDQGFSFCSNAAFSAPNATDSTTAMFYVDDQGATIPIQRGTRIRDLIGRVSEIDVGGQNFLPHFRNSYAGELADWETLFGLYERAYPARYTEMVAKYGNFGVNNQARMLNFPILWFTEPSMTNAYGDFYTELYQDVMFLRKFFSSSDVNVAALARALNR